MLRPHPAGRRWIARAPSPRFTRDGSPRANRESHPRRTAGARGSSGKQSGSGGQTDERHHPGGAAPFAGFLQNPSAAGDNTRNPLRVARCQQQRDAGGESARHDHRLATPEDRFPAGTPPGSRRSRSHPSDPRTLAFAKTNQIRHDNLMAEGEMRIHLAPLVRRCAEINAVQKTPAVGRDRAQM